MFICFIHVCFILSRILKSEKKIIEVHFHAKKNEDFEWSLFSQLNLPCCSSLLVGLRMIAIFQGGLFVSAIYLWVLQVHDEYVVKPAYMGHFNMMLSTTDMLSHIHDCPLTHEAHESQTGHRKESHHGEWIVTHCLAYSSSLTVSLYPCPHQLPSAPHISVSVFRFLHPSLPPLSLACSCIGAWVEVKGKKQLRVFPPCALRALNSVHGHFYWIITHWHDDTFSRLTNSNIKNKNYGG